jgi:hypothetical protein
MAQTVGAVIERAKTILQEQGTGIRWKDGELIEWLNEAYVAVAEQRPDAHSKNDTLELQKGARQTIPSDGARLEELYATSDGHAIRPMDRPDLDQLRPGWQAEASTTEIEFYLLDPRNPESFWVYPPAENGTKVEGSYVKTPEQHATESLDEVRDDALSVDDRYAVALTDYVLYRAFAKDAEGQANRSRSQAHYQAFARSLKGKTGGDLMSNAEGEIDGSS